MARRVVVNKESNFKTSEYWFDPEYSYLKLVSLTKSQ